MGISEEELPGIGRRYELDVRDMDRLVAVVHTNGSRDLFAFRPGANEPRGAVQLDEASAVQLGAILSGAYYRPSFVEPFASLLDRFAIEAVDVPAGSPVAGRSIEELRVRARTGVTVIAVLSGKSTLLDPQPATVLAAGDTVVVVGQVRDIHRFEALVEDAAVGGEPSAGGGSA